MINYELFMINNRHNRIVNNNYLIQKLNDELNLIKPQCNKYASKILLLTDKSKKLNNQLKKLEEDYQKYKDTKILYYKSERIQYLCENLSKINEKINFTNYIYKEFKGKENLWLYLASFIKSYKQKKTLLKEEYGENISLIIEIFKYIKQYLILKISENEITEKNISDLLLRYNSEKDQIMIELDKLTTELEERKKFLWKYENKKISMKKLMEDILNEINSLSNEPCLIEYKQKRKKILQLQLENENYRKQIDNMFEITEMKNYYKNKNSI